MRNPQQAGNLPLHARSEVVLWSPPKSRTEPIAVHISNVASPFPPAPLRLLGSRSVPDVNVGSIGSRALEYYSPVDRHSMSMSTLPRFQHQGPRHSPFHDTGRNDSQPTARNIYKPIKKVNGWASGIRNMESDKYWSISCTKMPSTQATVIALFARVSQAWKNGPRLRGTQMLNARYMGTVTPRSKGKA